MTNLTKMAVEEQRLLALNRISQLLAEVSVQYAVIGESESASLTALLAKRTNDRVREMLKQRNEVAIQN